jgi:hypothetical protein
MKTYRISYTNPIINPIVVRATSLRTAINKATRQLEKVRSDLNALGLCADHLRNAEIQDATLECEVVIAGIDFSDSLKSLASL